MQNKKKQTLLMYREIPVFSSIVTKENYLTAFLLMSCIPGEYMSGLKRMSKHVLLMEPTALHAFRTTS